MSQNVPDFNRSVVRPVECLKEAWQLIKGQYWLFFGICLVGMLIGSAFAIVLMGPMMCGIFLCLFQHMRGEPVNFERLFKGFDFFGQAVIATLLKSIPVLIIIVPTYLLMVFGMVASLSASRSRGADVPVASFFIALIAVFVVILVIGVLLGIFFGFTFPLIVDRKLSGVDALKMSVKAAVANFGGVCGLVLLNFVLTFAGLLLCYVGALFVIPITMTALAVAYRRVFPEIPSRAATPPPLT